MLSDPVLDKNLAFGSVLAMLDGTPANCRAQTEEGRMAIGVSDEGKERAYPSGPT